MDSFLRFIDEHIDFLLNKKSEHGLIPEKLDEWVKAQVSERRRQAAAALASQLVYISFEEVRDMCLDLVKRMYAKEIPEGKTIEWFGVEPKKSGYFIAALCYHYATELGFPLPTKLHQYVIDDATDLSQTVLFCFDDMTYTGNQMGNRLRIIQNKLVKYNIKDADIRIGLLSSSEFAVENLTSRYIEPNFTFYYGRVIDSLRRILGNEQYIDCLVYFSLNNPDNFVYFEHKIADDVSTFLKVFKYGPVPPSTQKFSQEEISVSSEADIWYFAKKELTKILENEGLKLDSFLTQDDEEIDTELDHIKFIPFIHGCEIPEKIIEKRKNMNYIKFLELDDSEGAENSDFERCPRAFYKDLRGGRRKSRRKTKKNKRRLTTKKRKNNR